LLRFSSSPRAILSLSAAVAMTLFSHCRFRAPHQLSALAGALLSIFTLAWLRKVRIAL